MLGNTVICQKNNVEYIAIRQALCAGARTLDELKTAASVCGSCEGCTQNLDRILSSVCICRAVSLQTVVDAVKSGADTVQKVGEVTKAGTGCGRCQPLIENIISLGR